MEGSSRNRVALVSSASGSQSKDNTKKNRIRRTLKKAKETELEDNPKNVKSSLNKASVVDSRANSSVIKFVSNVNSNLKCASCNGCLFSDNHDACVVEYINSVNASRKSKSAKKPVKRKADIEIFIGYAPTKKAFRIYNRRTTRIVKTIHVDFDELTVMASEQSSSGPALNEMTSTTISSGLVQKPSSSTPYVPPSRND
uniref:Retrovirus-related Pol polyprotein from transposon TNT 1-94 n=1 Tax=Tanacetum cinerariifolium TaxID=118510 RepID=A0A6L2NH08_TANCI|nr:retrovirus-related Pol polyprotein from transposon TNT 1-94 [Tanacetum cinerariifolium]